MRRARALCLSVFALCTALPAGAADWDFDVQTGFEFQGDTDLDHNGEFDFWLWHIGGSASSEVAPDLRMNVDADYRLIGYDFSGLGFDPWEEVHVFSLRPSFRISISDEISLLVGPIFEFSGETSADFGDSLTGGGLFGVGYRFSPDLHLTLGLIVSSEIEDDVYLQPLVMVNWKITDQLKLLVDADGPRGGLARLAYTPFEDWTVSLGGGFRRERFRLNHDRPTIRRDGVGQEEAAVLFGSVAYAFTEKISLEGYVGGTLDGEFKLDNKRGHRIDKEDYDDAVYGGFRLKVGF